MKQSALWVALALAVASGVAYSEEFKCLEGARDPAPYKPGNVVRWCEIEKDGRLLYHGSVWRWYRSGQIAGKEFYVYGNAEGEWPSWYENGKPSSLGTFKSGSKTGLWKYWDEAGWLKTEVTYTDKGNHWTEYYPTGKRRATGQSVQSGKIGVWTYWERNGTEKAKCDFGDGLFTLTSKPCQIIAEDVEPKGYSRPIPVGMTVREGSALVRVSSQSYQFAVPAGWVADTKAGKREQAPLVFYPKGSSWRSPEPNMYVRVLYKNGTSFEEVVKHETENFEQNVEEYAEKATRHEKMQNGRRTLSKTISYKPLIETDSPFSIVAGNSIHEAISYLDVSDDIVLMAVLACLSERELKESTPALMSLVRSLRIEPMAQEVH